MLVCFHRDWPVLGGPVCSGFGRFINFSESEQKGTARELLRPQVVIITARLSAFIGDENAITRSRPSYNGMERPDAAAAH
ncbi:hypothetical protein [Bradyrhizobium sp. 27S5]|uniref:hypothetical protein n=1 Tax=Bradyrhizobium sp. 27S5 TaxID=3139728 RepID=UPI0030CBC4FF